MTPENLERHIKLQPLYRKMMGEWQNRDWGYVEGLGTGTIHNNGLMYFDNGTAIHPCHCKDIVRLPLSIDPKDNDRKKRGEKPRGLWGMVDWNKLRYEQWGPDGEIAIFKLPFIHFNEEMGIPIKDHPFIVGYPETALLKALCEQEGV